MDTGSMIRIPLNGTFELTARCNLHCKMCLTRIDNDAKSLMNEKSAKEWIDMARQVKQAGTLGLLLTGGEPLLRPDFAEIYSEIASMGFVLSIYTNATLITDEIFDLFRKLPPHNIGVTVYGASGKTYRLVTGSSDAYDRMLEGVDRLRRLPSRLTVRTTIIKDNLEDLDRISTWAKGLGPEVGFNVSRIVTMPVRGGIADAKAHRLSPAENVAMLKKIYMDRIIEPLTAFFRIQPDIDISEKLADILKEREEEYNRIGHKQEGTIYGCEAGVNSYTITWDGKLIGCQILDDCCTYPFEEGFIKAWEDFPSKVKLLPLPDKCKGCSTPCTSCYATRLAETGSMGGWPEYICREAKLKEKMEEDLLKELYANIVRTAKSTKECQKAVLSDRI